MKKYSNQLQYSVVILVFAMVIWSAVTKTIANPRYDLILASSNLLTKSYFYTIWISIITLCGSMFLGFIVFVMIRSKITIFRAIATVFSEIIMGTPLLVMIFLVVYPLGRYLESTDKLTLGIFALILYNCPYVANAYLTTSAVVTDNQYVVMDLYHFKWYQKYIYIILPQMVRPFLPSLINQLSSVIKCSALLNIVAINEITYITTVVANKNYAIIEGYYVMWLMYLAVTIPLSLLAKYIGKRVEQ